MANLPPTDSGAPAAISWDLANDAHPVARPKFLAVDDSKLVRIIVKTALKPYDCDLIEATDGVEGLALAAKEKPDLIFLDVCMPVMGGIEMLRQLRADSALKHIPVLMLTAEVSRETVLSIAKIGVNDYIVKPFKQDILLEKIRRLIDLKLLPDSPSAKTKTLFDPATILVVDDKPVIITQIQAAFKTTPWQVHSVGNVSEAMDFCSSETVNLVIVSLTLPDEAAFALFCLLRASHKTKDIPVMGLVVKNDLTAQQHALQVGYSAIITKPIDLADLKAKAAKAMNVDTSQRYFHTEPDLFVLKLPETCPAALIGEISEQLKVKVSDSVDCGISKAVFDLQEVKSLDKGHIKLLLPAMQICRDLALNFVLVGSGAVVKDSQNYEAMRTWQFYATIEEARASFSNAAAAPAAPAAAAPTAPPVSAALPAEPVLATA